MKDMVPRSRLNEVIAERDNAKKDHADVLKRLGQLEKDSGDVQSLKDQIKQMQEAAKEARKAHDAQIKQMKGAKTGESGNEDGDHRVDTSKMTYSEVLAYTEYCFL